MVSFCLFRAHVHLGLLLVLISTGPSVHGNVVDLADAGKLGKKEVKDELMSELVKSLKDSTSGRLSELHTSLARMYSALPKEKDGNLEHNVVRYALHRLLLKEHGWFIKGLEPDGPSASKDDSARAVSEWVPSYLQAEVEKQMKGTGISLSELTALAATLEDVVHKEEERRLHKLYSAYGVPEQTMLDEAQATELIDAYMMVFIRGGEISMKSAEDTAWKLRMFKERYEGWSDLQDWVRKVQARELEGRTSLGFSDIVRIAKAVGNYFGGFNDMECLDLKKTLLSIEDTKPGRVRLGSFYNMSLHTHWSFNEKKEYLRDLGALDDSDPSIPRVIVSNYLASRPNCLESSEFYAVCCRNECEDLMGKLEDRFADTAALPSEIASFVRDLPSDTVRTPREMSPALLSRLDQVAGANGGRVPLHGRLFAMWMHHAFPRECPYPHESGTINPQTADAWMRDNKQTSTGASDEEMVCHVNGPCSDSAKAETVDAELPWMGKEELLGMPQQPQPQPSSAYNMDFAAEPVSSSTWMEVFRHSLRTLTLACVALGLALASRRHFDSEKGGPCCGGGTVWEPVLVLLVFPLAVLTMEYGVGQSANEMFLCFLCWCLAGLLAKRTMLDSVCRALNATPIGSLLGWRQTLPRHGGASAEQFVSFPGV